MSGVEWLFIPGVAEHKGSTRAFIPKGWSRPVITDTNSRAKGWQAVVAAYVRNQIAEHHPVNTIPYARPSAVRIGYEFVRPRNTTAPKSYTPALTTKPDIDKLLRALLDGLTGTLFTDDSQVVGFFHSEKRTAERDEQPGCWLAWYGFGIRDKDPRPLIPPVPYLQARTEESDQLTLVDTL